jgi:hypothetical protein
VRLIGTKSFSVFWSFGGKFYEVVQGWQADFESPGRGA